MGGPSAASGALFVTPGFYARELDTADLPALQALFDANPEYFLAVCGRRAGPDEARAEFEQMPPAEVSWSRRWFAGLYTRARVLQGLAVVASDLPAAGVWHVALFLLATPLHGTGAAQEVYGALEAWARDAGARWLRLGVVQGHARAERFWEGRGFREVRQRPDTDTGGRLNTVRVLVKPLAGGELGDYLSLAPRDRPDSAQP